MSHMAVMGSTDTTYLRFLITVLARYSTYIDPKLAILLPLITWQLMNSSNWDLSDISTAKLCFLL